MENGESIIFRQSTIKQSQASLNLNLKNNKDII